MRGFCELEKFDWEEAETFETKQIGESVNPNYGMDRFGITRDQINDLLNGKVLYGDIQGGEYAIVIKLKDGDGE